jgi:hypothetical protein
MVDQWLLLILHAGRSRVNSDGGTIQPCSFGYVMDSNNIRHDWSSQHEVIEIL